jgi:uncharacterized cupredoxin-like copper-binding protein
MRMRVLTLAGVSAGLVLAGCTSSTSPGMMGHADSRYHYSSLTCSAPSALPGHTVRVTLADMGMTKMMGGTAPMGQHVRLTTAPTTVNAGAVSLVASNRGWRTHELVILPLVNHAIAGQRIRGRNGKVDESGSLGEASGSCVRGTGEGIEPGTVGWTTITLTPGRYELICNLRNHYADGMHQELVVV